MTTNNEHVRMLEDMYSAIDVTAPWGTPHTPQASAKLDAIASAIVALQAQGEAVAKDAEFGRSARAFIGQLRADYERPEGRWGMHGHSSVDDDYFEALRYVIEKFDKIDTAMGGSKPE